MSRRKSLIDMWFAGKSETTKKDILFNYLIEECKVASPGAKLSYQLQNRLERFPCEVRKEIACRKKDGCTPLFVASKRGNVDIVEYLITVCKADIEQKCVYEVPDDRSVHCVTPLWCAAVTGKLAVIECLVKHGANVNSTSDSGSTPVRSACFMTHLEIVSFLVDHGADILQANYNGGTCLINSVQSVQLCLYLLQHGASVNTRDIQNKTALHYAIQEHRFETTKLLLDYGANPHARSRYNDDALQTACLKGATHIFDYLVSRVTYGPSRMADAHELMGSTFLDEHNDATTAVKHWTLATQLRYSLSAHLQVPLEKEPKIPQRALFRNAVEFKTMEELNNVVLDVDAMRIQSLLICERILGAHHKDTLFRLMYRGAAYADALRYQRCIELWRRALEIRVEKDTILYADTCFTAQALIRLFVDLNEKNLDGLDQNEPRFFDVAATLELLTDNVIPMRKLLEIHPVQKRQQENFDRTMKSITHLVYLLVKIVKTSEEQNTLEKLVTKLVTSHLRSSITGDTLLHLCVSRLNTIKSSYFSEQGTQMLFPNLQVIELFLNCGALVNARNESRSTPLHVAANPYNFHCPLVKMLLDHGAHPDTPNKAGDCPWTQIVANPLNTVNLLNYMTLRCLAATTICKNKIPYTGQIPTTLEAFVRFHE